jgi:hypothetical protein
MMESHFIWPGLIEVEVERSESLNPITLTVYDQDDDRYVHICLDNAMVSQLRKDLGKYRRHAPSVLS